MDYMDYMDYMGYMDYMDYQRVSGKPIDNNEIG